MLNTLYLDNCDELIKWKALQEPTLGNHGKSELKDLPPPASYPALLVYNWDEDELCKGWLHYLYVYPATFEKLYRVEGLPGYYVPSVQLTLGKVKEMLTKFFGPLAPDIAINTRLQVNVPQNDGGCLEYEIYIKPEVD